MTSTGNAGCFKNELYNSVPNVPVWPALEKTFTLKGVQTIHYVQEGERA
jgi:hypothetical protein